MSFVYGKMSINITVDFTIGTGMGIEKGGAGVEFGCGDPIEIPRRVSDPLTPISSGEEKCVPGHFWGPGVRSNFLIHYVISGTGVFYCGTEKHIVGPGQIFVIFPGTIVKYQADGKNPWQYAWINFYGEEIREVFDWLGITLARPVYTLENGVEFLEILRGMPREKTADLWNNLRFSAALYELISLLVENRCDMGVGENRYLTIATRYIKAHYYEEITVEQVAWHTGISRKYLFIIFKKRLGISPKEYIIDYKIKRAKGFLLDRSLPISHVAYSVGYKDQLNFSKIFKQKTGFSPSEYRDLQHNRK